MKSTSPENSTISSNLRAISARLMPRITPFRNTFSRPVRSGWNPAPTSINADSRPVTSIRPSVGHMIRAKCLSIVLLPAPLWPITPTVSPCLISRLIWRSAQNSRSSRKPPWLLRPDSPLIRYGTRSRSVSKRSPLRKRLDTSSKRMAMSLIRCRRMTVRVGGMKPTRPRR